jgi:hypothetical protein
MLFLHLPSFFFLPFIIIIEESYLQTFSHNLFFMITAYLPNPVPYYFNGYFSVNALTIALALSAAGSPSLIITAIASAI